MTYRDHWWSTDDYAERERAERLDRYTDWGRVPPPESDRCSTCDKRLLSTLERAYQECDFCTDERVEWADATVREISDYIERGGVTEFSPESMARPEDLPF